MPSGAAEVCLDRQLRAADAVLAARRSFRQIEPPSDLQPDSLDEAYAVQDFVIAGLLADHGGQSIGWKVGCTNAAAQQLLGLGGPFYGRLLSPFVHDSPVTLDANRFHMLCVEAEFAVEVGRDFAAGDAPFNRAGVADHIRSVLPAIEIVDTRFVNWRRVGATWLVADNGSAGHWVRGKAVADWRGLDLAGHQIALRVNEQVIREGVGANVMGHPFEAVRFLANDLARRGRALRAGDIVSTGTAIEVYYAKAGDRIDADFGELGTCSVAFA